MKQREGGTRHESSVHPRFENPYQNVACRAKLVALVPDDAEGRTYAEAIAEKLVQLALKGDIRAAQELADRGEGRPSQMAPPAEQRGVKVVVIDVPRPQHGTFMPDVGPSHLPPK
jgi:hypothetical protein